MPVLLSRGPIVMVGELELRSFMKPFTASRRDVYLVSR